VSAFFPQKTVQKSRHSKKVFSYGFWDENMKTGGLVPSFFFFLKEITIDLKEISIDRGEVIYV
jgi:hypothetical protein